MTMRTILYEDSGWRKMLPLTYGRAACQLMCGAGSLLDRAQRLLDQSRSNAGRADDRRVEVWSRPVLSELIQEQTGCAVNRLEAESAVLLNGRGFWNSLPPVEEGDAPWVGTAGPNREMVCIWADDALMRDLTPQMLLQPGQFPATLPERDVSAHVKMLEWPWNLIHHNQQALFDDWELFQPSGPSDRRFGAGVHVLAAERVVIGEGTKIKPCVVIDAENGPVWIGRNVTILPHTFIQGPACIGDGCLIQPGAVIHAATTIGPRCKVGGEIEASIIQGYSNKQHDGFLGHSYIGSWVNIAADCINSDLKNTYGNVRVPIAGRDVDSGEMFVGMIVGDHSKTGINVSFPTGAVVGYCSSVFTPSSPKFVPSFTWIDGDSMTSYDEERGVDLAHRVMARRDKAFTAADERVFRSVRRIATSIEQPVAVR